MPSPYPPIADYALLSDCHSAALVSKAGSVDWCCFHRVDARPLFARILDSERGGFFRVGPVDEAAAATRRYIPDTNVLETTFETGSGRVALTDCIPIRDDGSPHPYHQLVRSIRCDAGEVEIAVEFAPMFDYGLTTPRVELRSPHLAVAYGGADALVLSSDLELRQIRHERCEARATLRAGDTCVLALNYFLANEIDETRYEAAECTRRIDATVTFWRDWAARCAYEGPYRDAVVRSALVVKALTNAPTGAIAAAPTTSLPEDIGGVRNWDYRYTWLRDAALNLYALFSIGYTDEAHAFMTWLRRTTAGRATDLRVLYGVGGERLVPEIELTHLDGYRSSRPVRIGNAASDQFQLDVYGELVDTAWLFHRYGGEIDPAMWDFICELVELVASCWEDPDHGVWEVRCEPQHFVSSKVMAWVAVDRAIRLATALGLDADLPAWRALRDAIRARVESDGVGADGGFARSFGSEETDASNLLIPLVKFLPANDPRVRATFERVAGELTVNGFVHRYAGEDGLPGGEGAFLICSFWLVDNLAQAGELDRARELYERLLACTNDVGLLAEEIDPRSSEMLGNFPQTFSHVGLIGAAMNLQRATRAATGDRS